MIKLRKHQQRVVNEMLKHQRGQLIVPTGGGKTMCMITDAMSQFSSSNKTIVVVAPRILLTQQLCEDCLLYTSPSPRDKRQSRMPSSA